MIDFDNTFIFSEDEEIYQMYFKDYFIESKEEQENKKSKEG